MIVFQTSRDGIVHSFIHLENLLKKIDNENKEIYILGDLNCDLIKLNPDNPTKKLLSLLEIYQLSQLIDTATRITMHSSTLIDHFITNEPDKISKFGVIHTGISDHSLIYGIRKTNIFYKDNGNILEIRNMKKFNEEKFLCDLGMQSWDYVYFFADNPNTMWEIWKDLFLQILDKHAPLQSKKIKSKSSPWITSHLKHLIITRDNLKRKAVITKLDTDWEKYKKARNETNTKLRQAKRDYFSIKISAEKQNPKAAWKTINTLLGRHYQPSKVNELNINDMKFTKPKDIAEGFNTFFSNIGPNLAEEIDTAESNFKDYLDKTISEFTAFQSVTVNHVCHLLCELPGSKATGLDKISSKLIKLAAPIISDSLTYIFNQSITLCTFPHEWKIARVIPLFKNGKRSLPGNYRPISVLPAISKVMERILYNQLYEYLTANNVLSEHQFGFRKFHSTASALLDCTNDWYINMDRKLFNLVVFIDLKKAFDTVDHEILLQKLMHVGITGNALLLIKSYLIDRTQRCEVNGFISRESRVKCGVPQGSILGPLFFLLYINDLPTCLNKTKPRLFADDTNITATGECLHDIEDAVNSDLENLRQWLIANKLSLNVAKTEFQIIGTKPMLKKASTKKLNIHIQNKPIKQVFQCKTLGVTLDENLSWKSNTDALCKKISSGIYALKHIKEYVDKEILLAVYNAIIQPYFSYCCEVWNVLGETQSMRLQKLHNRAARIIARVPNEVDQQTVLSILGWEPLEQQRKKAKAKMMFKTLNNMGPNSLKKLFIFEREILNHSLRGTSSSIRLPKPNTNNMKKSFMYDGASIWNSLPENIRESKSISCFKRKIATLSI